MYKTLLITICLTGIIPAGPDAKDIMRKSQKVTKVSGIESIATLTIINKKGNKRIRKFSSASKDYGNTTKMVIRFLEPADVKGTGILTFDNEERDDDMWLFMPALRKTRRIVSTEKSKGFMGSEFSNADMTTPNISDFNYKLLGSEKVVGQDCWKIEALPASGDIADENGYSKRINWIQKENSVGRKTAYYDLDDELLKVMTVHKIELLDKNKGKYQPSDIEIKNVQNGRSSRFIIDKVVLNPNVKDEYFTTQFLEK